jgi:formylglycine-generating enzyme
METLIKNILDIIPFKDFFKYIGVNNNISSILSLLICSTLILIANNIINRAVKKYKSCKIAKDLAPYFDKLRIEKSTKYYIQTKGQNISPSYEEEPSSGSKFIVRTELIPWFIKTVFTGKSRADKYYIILADSGMGKTTFLINLYIKYHSFLNLNRNYNMLLLPFGDDRIIDILKEKVKNQNDVKNTILLLDAFDEYKGILPPDIQDGLSDEERFKKKFEEIVNLTRDYRVVVITSRTQYFPDENKPYELNIPKYGETEGFHTLAKLYLSPFSEYEINKYLNKKFGKLKFQNFKKKQIAETVIKKSPKLMVRPMLLSYIDYLITDNNKYYNTYQIYNTLIMKWIEREAAKRKYETTSRDKFMEDLESFSNKIAIIIYNQRKTTHALKIDKQEAINICSHNNINLTDYEITGQSLLTKDATQNWKFAHKSILEFFIAKEAIENTKFMLTLDTTSFNMTEKFCLENGYSALIFSNFQYIKGGAITSTSFINQYQNKEFFIDDFYICKYVVGNADYLKVFDSLPQDKYNSQYQCNLNWYAALKFCNQLNNKAGFNNVYDNNGNFLTPEGKITKKLSEVKGYRLPIEMELVYYATNYNDDISKLKYEIKNSSYYYDWCYDWFLDNDEPFFKNLQHLNKIIEPQEEEEKLIFSIFHFPSNKLTRGSLNPDEEEDYVSIRLVFCP